MAKTIYFYFSIIAVVFLMSVSIVVAQTEVPWPSSQTQEVVEEPAIEPEADEILKQMGDYLKSVNEFIMSADTSFDIVLDSGQKIQDSATVTAAVRKPNRFQSISNSGDSLKRFWFDGSTVTIFNPKFNFYAVTEVPDSIDKAIEVITTKYNFSAPLSDFALDDPYQEVIDNVESGFYVGMDNIGGILCHHLAFSQPGIDWQIWIQDNPKRPLPRKVVITYNDFPKAPQYTAYLHGWNMSPILSDDLFTFNAPEKAVKIDFLPLEGIPMPASHMAEGAQS